MPFQPARMTMNWGASVGLVSNIFCSSVRSLARGAVNARRIVSFSLYDNIPLYSLGAIENAKLMKDIYPDWVMYVYHGLEVDPDVISSLLELGCVTTLCSHVINRPPEPLSGISLCGKFWRFMALAEPGIELAIFRDSDSRINVREKAAVMEWIDSGKALHTMRDHHCHTRRILAGMWGCRAGRFDMISALSVHKYTGKFIDDELFLGGRVRPK